MNNHDIESRLSRALHLEGEIAMSTTDTQRELEKFHDSLPRERRRFRLGIAAAAAAVVALLGGGTAIGLAVTSGHDRAAPTDHDKQTPRLPAPQPTVAPTAIPATALVASSPDTFNAPAPGVLINGAVWVNDNVEGKVVRLDPTSLRTLSSTPYSAEHPYVNVPPTLVGGSVVVPGVADGKVYVFDPRTGALRTTFAVDSSNGLAVTPKGTFLETGQGKVALLNAAGRPGRSMSMTADTNIAYASGKLWGWDGAGNDVVGVDPATGRVQSRVHIDGINGASLASVGSDALLVTDSTAGAPSDQGSSSGTTARVDTRSLKVTAVSPAGSYSYSTADRGTIWTVTHGRQLVQLDAGTLRMLHNYTLPEAGSFAFVIGNRVYVTGPHALIRAYSLAALR